MVRLLRYPRTACLFCCLSLLCALGCDWTKSIGQDSLSLFLLTLLLPLLVISILLLSSRFCIDSSGITCGDLFSRYRVEWKDIGCAGILYCNSRRPYFYGMYDGNTDFLRLLRKAPRIGSWGFVVPVNRNLMHALERYCPFKMDYSVKGTPKSGKNRTVLFRQSILPLIPVLAAVLISFHFSAALINRISGSAFSHQLLPLCTAAVLLLAIGAFFLYRLALGIFLIPSYNENGICSGGLFISWKELRLCYIQRHSGLSSMFLLDTVPFDIQNLDGHAVCALSIPDLSELILACQYYCKDFRKKYANL